MATDNVSHRDPHEQQPPTLIPLHVDDIDCLNAVARNLDGLVLIVGAAAAGSPAFAAVDGILQPIDEQLQEFKTRFNHAWRVATDAVDQ
jgi:hypothetical protein